AQGGTLVQHIEGHRKDIGNGDMDFIDEKVELVGSTKVAALLERDTMDARSSHHQTIDRTSHGLMVAAYAPDQRTEAKEQRDKGRCAPGTGHNGCQELPSPDNRSNRPRADGRCICA